MFVRGGSVLTLDANHADKQTSAELGGVLEVHLYRGPTGGRVNVMVEDDGITINAPARRTSFAFDGKSKLAWTVSVDARFVPTSMAYTTMFVSLFTASGSAVQRHADILIGSGGNISFP